DLREVSPCFLRPFANEAHAPFDQMRIGELKDYAVTNLPRALKRFWPVAGDPDGWNTVGCPWHLNVPAVLVDSFRIAQISNYLYGLLESLDRGWLLAHHSA